MSRARGYTLIELVMTLALLTVGVPPLINLGTNCLRNMKQSSYVSTAASLCQEKLETILNDKSNSARGYSYITQAHYAAEASVAGFAGYSRSVTVDADSTYNSITFRNVSVTTTAPDNTQITLSTWVLNQ